MLLPADASVSSAAELSGQGARIAILQNAFADELVQKGVADAEVQQFDSVANSVLALDSGRVDATAIDLSTAQWKTAETPDKYKVATDSWQPQSYAAAVKPGDQQWLNYVNTVLHEAMTGVEFESYAAAFQQFFNVELTPPQAGFPTEFN